MRAGRWLPHPPATIGRRPCPTGLPRYSSRWLALAALPIGTGDARLTPVACPRCDGWHLHAANTPTVWSTR